MALGMIIPAACMLSFHLLKSHNVIGFIILLTLCMMGHHFAGTCGYYFSHSDVAGPFSGTLFGTVFFIHLYPFPKCFVKNIKSIFFLMKTLALSL